ncbi:hypothetical protein KAX97_01555 [candidate division WOR-3 bacterium]|nr:hypothetical protein [candidate division WOR-3 bacterium]
MNINRHNLNKKLDKIQETIRARRLRYLKEYRTGDDYRMQREAWLNKHPKYYQEWCRNNPHYYISWRNKNRSNYNEYQRQWRRKNQDRRRFYIRNYMRRYRKRNVNNKKNILL